MKRRDVLTGLAAAPVVLSLPALPAAASTPASSLRPKEWEPQAGDVVVVRVDTFMCPPRRNPIQLRIVEEINQYTRWVTLIWFGDNDHMLHRSEVPMHYFGYTPSGPLKIPFLMPTHERERETLSPENRLLAAIMTKTNIPTKTAMPRESIGEVITMPNGASMLLVHPPGSVLNMGYGTDSRWVKG